MGQTKEVHMHSRQGTTWKKNKLQLGFIPVQSLSEEIIRGGLDDPWYGVFHTGVTNRGILLLQNPRLQQSGVGG